MGRRVRRERGGVVVNYLYSGDTVVAEGNGTNWVYSGYGSAMLTRGGANPSTDTFQQWSLRGDLVAQSNRSGVFSPAPITDAFGGLVSGDRQVYEENILFGHMFFAFLNILFLFNGLLINQITYSLDLSCKLLGIAHVMLYSVCIIMFSIIMFRIKSHQE